VLVFHGNYTVEEHRPKTLQFPAEDDKTASLGEQCDCHKTIQVFSVGNEAEILNFLSIFFFNKILNNYLKIVWMIC
jgi:hypothetical protein